MAVAAGGASAFTTVALALIPHVDGEFFFLLFICNIHHARINEVLNCLS